jgi:Holliday junction resolvasome RuvABC endonuclease subunit
MSYCSVHHTNNCVECAIERQTKEIVKALERILGKNRPSETQTKESFVERVMAALKVASSRNL